MGGGPSAPMRQTLPLSRLVSPKAGVKGKSPKERVKKKKIYK